MDPVAPSGHRRRRSSLINPANASNSRQRSPRATSQSIRTPAAVDDEDKIVEESSGEESLRPGEVLDEEDTTEEDLHDDEETGLTGKDRRRKRRKRRRNQLIDQRIVKDDISPEEKKQADLTVVRRLLINGALIGLWYFFSLLISLYNKWMFSPDKLNFRFPMFTTAVHFLVQFSLASLILLLFPSLRPKNGHRSDLGQSRHGPEPARPVMTKMFYLTRIGPCGVATGLDIGLGNTSLQFITLTFYTMCKSSSLAFVLLFAFLFRLETPTWKLVGIIATMTLGVVMMVAGEVEFKFSGFVLVISAAFFSGFRWGLTQILLLRNPATSNPFSSIFFLAPVMFLTLICIAVPVEGAGALLTGLRRIADEKGALVAPLIIVFPGIIAFLMTASEFALLQRTSVVTLSIAGIFKEAVTILAAAVVFGDTMTAVNVVGLVVTLAAIAAYNWIKISKMRSEVQTDVHRGHLAAAEAVLPGGSSSSNSVSDGEDGHGEDADLLRGSVDNDEVLFTADGGDVVAGPGPALVHGRVDGTVPREGRTD
ncbi:TPT-domain-containing protein [Parathielavia appendiculata]|uniref:TPT-domain-containing protein n=1 Tax=Parathielavia appendiculata TaxID=2587402 RepID=A0AAN6U938_9PEZI|nr:TPT-domain-containing protein [Parathielavia appendiculata]